MPDPDITDETTATGGSVGLVTPQKARFDRPLALDSGVELAQFELVYETYGILNAKRSNAILVCHALSSDHHAAGYHDPIDRKPGWWDDFIGPGKPMDTRYFFIVCCNNIGGCRGSTGPNTLNPATGRLYGPDFPIVTVSDWVNAQVRLADYLGIECWAAVIGGSLGGMQAMQWAVDYPKRLRHAVVIAAAASLSAQNIAFNEVARQAIMTDPEFHGGRYYEHNTVPRRGLMLARMLGHITYLSARGMDDRFGRELKAGLNFSYEAEFQVESYLRYQGMSFVDHFDANTYLLITKMLDYFDLAAAYGGDLAAAFRDTDVKFLLISFASDWRFSSMRSRAIAEALAKAGRTFCYEDIEVDYGHDSFLIPTPRYTELFSRYLQRVSKEVG